jgi:3-phenylpropionate/cinnamic acid dioxygenase small subunit
MTSSTVADAHTFGDQPAVSVEVDYRVRHFLNYETRLLDERMFHEWVQLFCDDATYEIPVRLNREMGSDPFGSAKSFDDSKQTLGIRVDRLYTDFAWSEQPPSR